MRAGRQTGEFVTQFENRTPSRAIQSIFGVLTQFPVQPSASARSWSHMMNKMLGLGFIDRVRVETWIGNVRGDCAVRKWRPPIFDNERTTSIHTAPLNRSTALDHASDPVPAAIDLHCALERRAAVGLTFQIDRAVAQDRRC